MSERMAYCREVWVWGAPASLRVRGGAVPSLLPQAAWGAREETCVRQPHFPSACRSQTRAGSWQVNLAVTWWPCDLGETTKLFSGSHLLVGEIETVVPALFTSPGCKH